MTLYLSFAGLGTLTYTGVALAATAIADASGAHVPFGLQFPFFASTLGLLGAVVLRYVHRLPQAHGFTADRVAERSGRPSSSPPHTLRPTYAKTMVANGGGIEVELSDDNRSFGDQL